MPTGKPPMTQFADGKVIHSSARRWYDALTLLLLMWPATGGMWLLGSTRTWAFAPGLVLAFCGIALAASRPLWFADTPAWRWPAGWWIFAALTTYVVALAPSAMVPYAARWEALKWLCLLGALWSWTQLANQPRRWRVLVFILLLSVALICLYAIVQRVGGSRQVLWAPRPEQYGLRASGTYLCPNHLANVLATLFPLAILLLFCADAGFPLRLMGLYFLGVATPVLYWTQSRSAWAGLLVGCITSLLLLAWRKSRALFALALVALPLLAAGGGWVAWRTLPLVQERVQPVLERGLEAGGGRLDMWRDSLVMIRERSITGFSGGSFVWAYPPYQKHVKYHLLWDYLHNEYLQLQVEYGAIGSGLLVAGLLWGGIGLLVAFLRAQSAGIRVLLAAAAGAVAGNMVHALFDFNFHIFPNPHVLAWLIGVAWGAWFLEEGWRKKARPQARGWRMAVAGGAVLVCLCAAWRATAAGLSYYWNLRGDIARSSLNWDAAAADYARASRWDARNWQPHAGLGMLRQIQAFWYRDPDEAAEKAGREELATEAAVHLRRAAELNPGDMAVVYTLGLVHNLLDDPEGALAEFRRAAAYQHKHIFYREQLGVQLRRMGRDTEALAVFRQNVADGKATDISTVNIRLLERKLAKPPAP